MRKTFLTRIGCAGGLRGAAIAGLAFAAVGLGDGVAAEPSAPETAAPVDAARSLALDFRFFIGGIFLGDATFTAELVDGAYAASSRLETEGVAEWFYEATFDFTAAGRQQEGRFAPDAFRVEGAYEENQLRVSIDYGETAPVAVSSEPPFQPRPYQVDPTEQHGALDPISAMVAAITPRPGQSICERTIPIFDGRRRYDFVIGEETDRSDPEETGELQTIDCEVRLRRVAGFKPKFMSRPDIVFEARVELQPDGRFIPTRIWGDTPFGTFVGSIQR